MKRRLLPAVAVILCLGILCGCDTGLEIIGIQVNTYPNRIVYIAGIDSKLDLTGGTVTYLRKDGKTSDDSMDSKYLEVAHNIHFNEPGIYSVTVSRGKYSCSFPVQVISKSYVDEIAGKS